jgi:putative transposase
MDAPRSGSSEPWIVPVSVFRCGPSSGSCDCPWVDSIPGDASSTRVPSTGQSSCPHTSPHRLTPSEIWAIKDIVTAIEYRHVPTGTLAVLAQRLGTVWASPSTWYQLVRKFGWRRPRLRVHPAKPKVGLRTTRADEMWHIDTTVIRLLDGARAYVHAVIDNFSRRILAWRVADTFTPVNSVAVLVEASQGATSSTMTPVVLADPGVENVNSQIDDLIATGVLRRVLAFTELKFSNSMIEAWWRSLKHQWLFLHSLDSVTTVRRLVEFYVQEHNQVLPHSAFRGQTPDEMYFYEAAEGTRSQQT